MDIAEIEAALKKLCVVSKTESRGGLPTLPERSRREDHR